MTGKRYFDRLGLFLPSFFPFAPCRGISAVGFTLRMAATRSSFSGGTGILFPSFGIVI